MSFVKISDLTEKVTLAGTEEVLINDSGTSKKMATQRFLDVQAAAEAAQTAAEAAQTAAETAETNAETAETNAAASASAASTSASNASTSATNASNSATAASNAQSAAETARDQTLTAFDSFDDRYLGQKASAPTLDNDGDPLVAGSLYFNTTSNEMKVYDGSAWLNAYASLSGALLATNNLSDLNDAPTARTNLGLGTAATTASTDYATAAQGTNADTAYGWGNHASAGYLTGITGQSIESLNDVNTMTPSDGQLLTWDNANSRWDAADAPVSLPDQTGNSGKYLTSNGTIASWDALATVANSGAYSDLSGTPTNVSTFTNDSGYITGNQTITLSGDATGSGTTSITVTVADDSHNHIISNVDGLQSALDGKQPLDADLTAIAGLSAADGNFIVGSATGWVAESGATARTSLGLGALATLSTVDAATITDNSVGAAELNVTGNGTTSQYLRSDGDGTFTWATPTDTNTTYSAGSGLSLAGTTFSHLDTSSVSNVNNSGNTFIQDLTFDTYGHVTAVTSGTAIAVKAWVNFNGTGTVTIRASYNVSSISDNGTGSYTVNFSTAMPDTNYSLVGFGRRENDVAQESNTISASSSYAKTTSGMRIKNCLSSPAVILDSPEVNIHVFR